MEKKDLAVSRIGINAESYANNIRFLRKAIAGTSELCLVVKANAYGHGSRTMTQLAQSFGVKVFAVSDVSEAFEIYDLINPESRLIIMGDSSGGMEWAIKHGVEFYIYNPGLLKQAQKIAQSSGRTAKVHFELETGMNRLGLEASEIDEAVETLASGNIELMALCTHFAGAESITNFVRVTKQIKIFSERCRKIETLLGKKIAKHAACSAAALRFKNTRFDMIRIGILQYGFWPNQETRINYLMDRKNQNDPLRRVLTWKSHVMALKAANIGQYIGYGTSYLVEAKKKFAIIPIGYSSGFARSLSNQGRVLIGGKQAKVAGVVNMNALTVDVTDLPKVSIGDEVVLIGTQGEQTITVASFGDYSNQLNYELLARLPQDIPRVVSNKMEAKV